MFVLHARCLAPAGVGTGIGIRVSVGHLSTLAPALFAYDAPVVSTVSPAMLSPLGGEVMTLTGVNFGAVVTSGSITIDGWPCVAVGQQFWNDSMVSCTAPPAVSARAVLVVAVAGVASTSSVSPRFAAPVVTSMWPLTGGTAGGDVVVLNGSYFVTQSPLYVSVRFSRAHSASSAMFATVVNATSDAIVALTPPGSGTGWVVTVWNNDDVAGVSQSSVSGSMTFAYRAPSVASVVTVAGQRPMVGGFLVHIAGHDFSSRPTVTIGSAACVVAVGGANDSAITCTAPARNLLEDAVVRVTVDGRVAVGDRVEYDDPVVVAVSPAVVDARDTSSRSSLTVSGVNFGVPSASRVEGGVDAAPVNHTVYVGSAVCGDVIWASDTTLTCTIEGQQRVGQYSVTVVVGSQSSSSSPSASSAIVGSSTVWLQCLSGYYGGVGEFCTRCPAGGYCDGGLSLPQALVGYFPLSNTSDSFVECTPPEACLGGVNGTCAALYTGARCASCVTGAYLYVIEGMSLTADCLS